LRAWPWAGRIFISKETTSPKVLPYMLHVYQCLSSKPCFKQQKLASTRSARPGGTKDSTFATWRSLDVGYTYHGTRVRTMVRTRKPYHYGARVPMVPGMVLTGTYTCITRNGHVPVWHTIVRTRITWYHEYTCSTHAHTNMAYNIFSKTT
jgi:hypothetical protein